MTSEEYYMLDEQYYNPKRDYFMKFQNYTLAEYISHITKEWNESEEKKIPCQCGKQKDVRRERAFLTGYLKNFKGEPSKSASIDTIITSFIFENYAIQNMDEISNLIVPIVKNDWDIKIVFIQPPGDCFACCCVAPNITLLNLKK